MTVRVLFAGGGTGGHLYPALAVAEALGAAAPGVEPVFAGTARGIEARVIPARGLRLRTIVAPALVGAGIAGLLRSLAVLPVAALQAAYVLFTERPTVVVGSGGYASGPVTALAAVAGIPTVVLEQNAVAGRTNRILSRLARRVFATFADTRGLGGVVRAVGNPVRAALLAEAARPRPPRRSGDAPLLVVTGGSQGSRSINLSVVAWLVSRPPGAPPLRVVHQTGPGEHAAVMSAYRTGGLNPAEGEAAALDADGPSLVCVPFISDVGAVWRRADGALARAGSGTLSELALFGVPAVLVPLPWAADDHQRANARAWAETGAGLVVEQHDLSPAAVERAVIDIVHDVETGGRRRAAAIAAARPDAARIVAAAVCELAGIEPATAVR